MSAPVPPVPTALETVAAVHAGTTTARAATEAALARIAAVDGVLGAYQVVRGDRALAEADELDRRPELRDLPLAGLPIAVKDNIAVTGEPMRNGSAGSDPTAQVSDHEVVRRLRHAGAVVVGLTRVPELCVFGATDSVFGTTRNPWDPSRTPGGSSGGSAAAVASGTVAVAHGNDGMGSIRIPAACCGLFGIKPGRGVVPAQLGNGSWFDMAENGPLATTVADAALVLSVMAGRSELATVPLSAAPLRIAVSTRSPVVGAKVDPAYVDAALQTAQVLSGAGHTVVRADPPYPTRTALAALSRWFAGTEKDAQWLDDRSRVERRVRVHATLGRAVLRAGYPKESGRRHWQGVADRFFADHDVLMTPALAQLPLQSAQWSQRGWLANVVANSTYAPFAAPWNLAGWPAAVVPAGTHASGMPLSVQLVARPGCEQLLLQVAAQLEQLRPWARLAP